MIRRRKGHRKSREGCVQCKERHSKCSEVHPACLQCQRAGTRCSFSSPTISRPPINEDSLADLELLEHWHRNPVTGDLSETTRHLQYDLVRLGFSHHYLLNSILGLTALELYSRDRTVTKWYDRAVAHQQTAITRARPHFETVDQAQHQALLGFSAFTSMYTIAEPNYRPLAVRSQQTHFDPVEELMKALCFSRSTMTFVYQNFPSALVSGCFILSKFVDTNQDTVQGLEERFPQLAAIRGLVERDCAEEEGKACIKAANMMFRRIATLTDNFGTPEASKVIWGWGLEVPQPFLDMCLAKHPVALAILAHFPVLQGFYQEHWCMSGWPRGLLQFITGVLGPSWEGLLKWPRDIALGSGLPAQNALPSPVPSPAAGSCLT
ncbi:hypothetical protein F5X68DRAFT_246947 [Plectosphaerella plurivora]|uniref:Zn(2)-C6 fungal-type domain-containing protein n=1 Tax=Plectosphaerella plurivora TaxID=936078 RepID=A0A9P9A8D6_9PEZI|nr:hypothetical protein F5X68DRAFT_246947 [Plectosphaerella plurivora]